MDYSLELSGKRRITFIGDSFTAGHGVADVEERFVNQIRTMRPDLEIHAIARNGWDTSHEIDNLEKLWQLCYEFDQAVLVYV